MINIREKRKLLIIWLNNLLKYVLHYYNINIYFSSSVFKI